MLEHHLEARQRAAQRLHHAIDEHLLAVEQVDRRIRHLAVHEQRHPDFLHRLERLRALAEQVGHAGVRVRRRARRIELHAVHAAAFACAADFVGGRVVGQVQRHQRLERHAGRHRGQDALAVGLRLRGRRDGRLQVRHDDRAAELAGGVRQDGREHRAVAHVQVPVVGAGEGQRGGNGSIHGVVGMARGEARCAARRPRAAPPD